MLSPGLPDLSTVCVQLDLGPGQLCVRVPGGASICATWGLETGDTGDVLRGFIGSINSTLAPLAPVFNIIDTIKAAIDCIQAIPDCITSLNPAGLIDCIPDLVEKLEKLLALLPQLSVPALVADVIDVVIVMLLAIKADIQAFIEHQVEIADAATRAAETGNVYLQTVIDCETGNMDAELINLQESMKPLNRMMGIVNVLLGMAGLSPLPNLATLNEVSETVLLGFDVAIQLLETAKAALPV